MIGRLAIVALAVSLASCAGMEPAGRNARSSGPTPTTSAPAPQRTAPALPPPSQTPAPQPAPTQSAPPLVTPPSAQRQTAPTVVAPTPTPTPPPTQRTQPSVAAPQVSVPTPPPARPQSDDDDIVVPGQVQTQVPPPNGDPRSNEERRADVRAWDQCVTQVQNAFDSDPMRPQLTTPEEYCSQSLGMSDRTSVPASRRQRR